MADVPPAGQHRDPSTSPDVRRARDAVLARLSDPAAAVAPLVGPSAVLVPDAVLGTQPRAGHGIAAAAAGATDPGERRLARVAIPAAATAGVAAVALVVVLIAMLAGWTGAAPVVAALLLAVATAGLAGTAVHAGILGGRRPPDATRWESHLPWIGPLGTGSGRRLVGLACSAAERIAASAAWWSPELGDHRLTVDLAAELEQIDGQAYALALRAGRSDAAAAANTPSPVDTSDPEWAALLDHVAALTGYADLIERHALATRPGPSAAAVPLPLQPDPDAASTAAGAARDEFATAHLRQLAADLTARTQP